MMKKLQRYVLLSTAKAFLPAFIALVLLMAVGFCMQLLHQGLDVVRLVTLLRLVFAYSVPMVLPSAFLTAVIMTFGRLAADNELTAVRAAGIRMFRVVHPLLWAACGLAVVAAYFQFETVPRAQGSLRAMKYEALKQILLDKARRCTYSTTSSATDACTTWWCWRSPRAGPAPSPPRAPRPSATTRSGGRRSYSRLETASARTSTARRAARPTA